LFSVTDPAKGQRIQIAVQSIESGKRTVVMEQGRDVWPSLMDAHYVPTGHLLYQQGGTVFAVPFDLSQLKTTGNAVPVISGVRLAPTGEMQLAFSETGTLVYMPGPQNTAEEFDVAIADRTGNLQPLKLPPRSYQTPRVSPDGKRVALTIDSGTESNIWIYDFARATAPSRLTFGGNNRFPVWSSDGQWIAFQSDREGHLAVFRQRADGAGVAERLTRPEKNVVHVPESWSPKADVLLFRAVEGVNATLWSFFIPEGKSAPFGGVQSISATNAAFSPDGRWVAYHVREATKNTDEVFVQPFPANGSKYQLPISRDNHHPAWSRDGKELFYIPGPGEFSVIPVTTASGFVFGNPAPVRQVLQNYPPSFPRHFDVTADGKLIGLIPAGQTPSGAAAPNQINVIINWFRDLQQRVPVK
jgi:dipeptidyl aminopeptidase/acylaminoacyl peptidase